ncbi:MAG: tetratricopeptide repeat protein [Elusimicrobiota bacterium]
MKRQLAFILFGALFFEPALAAAQPLSEALGLPSTEERKLFRTAGELFEAERYPAAAKHYQDFLKKFPKHARTHEARMMLAESLYQQALAEAESGKKPPSAGALSKAANAFQEALKIIPKGDNLAESAAFRLAEIEFNLKKYEEAIARFSELQSDYTGGLLRSEARLLQAQSLMALQRPHEALPLLEAVLQDQPVYEKDARMQLAYGIALFDVGNPSGALKYLRRIKTPLGHLYAGRAELTFGRPLVAIENFRQVSKLDRGGEHVEISRFMTAEAFFAGHDYRSAIDAYQQFLRDYPQSVFRPGAMFKIGFSHYELEEFLAARGAFQSVLQLAANNEFAMLSLYMSAESFMKEGRLKEAGFAYADMAQTFDGPLAGNAQFKLAWTHLKLGNLPAAANAGKQMLLKHPNHPLASLGALLLGNILTHHKRYGEAVIAYQRALDMLKSTSWDEERKTVIREACLALLNRANLLGKSHGRLVSGYRYVLEEIKPSLNPWRAATLIYTAEGYFRQGLYDESLRIYREVLKFFPAAPESGYAVDGIAWCLFKKGKYAESEKMRGNLEAYRTRPMVAPSKTVLAEGKLPESLFTQSEFETATTLFNQKKFLESLGGYEQFEREHADHAMAAEAALQAGWSTYRLEYYGQAIKTWERVETQYSGTPTATKAAWATADTYFRAGQYEKAIVTYQRIIQTYGDTPAINHARLRIAQAYYNGKDVLKAIGAFEDLLREAPESAEAKQVLDFVTQLLYRPDAKDAALAALGRIADDSPGTPMAAQARYRIARHAYENREFEAAVKGLEPLMTRLTEAGDLSEAQFMLAEGYYNLKRYKEAAWAYERFTASYESDERYLPALFHLGASKFKLEEYEDAAKAFQSLYKKFPKKDHAPISLFNSALAYRKLGKWEDAALALKAYQKDYPEAAKTSNAMRELLAIYEEHHQYNAVAEVILAERDNLPPDDAQRLELTYRLGEAYASMGDDARAVSAYQELVKSPIKRNDFRISGLAKLGEHYERESDWRNALKIYEELGRSASRREWVEAARARAANAREKLGKGPGAKGADSGSSPQGAAKTKSKGTPSKKSRSRGVKQKEPSSKKKAPLKKKQVKPPAKNPKTERPTN